MRQRHPGKPAASFGRTGKRPVRRDDRAPHPDRPPGWDHVAAWYDRLVGDDGSDYHRHVILPAALRLLDPRPGERILDLCCGQGVLTRQLLERGAGHVLAVDASARLIAAAKTRGAAGARARFVVRDATHLDELADGTFDAAACVMAVQDVEDMDALFGGMGRALRPAGRAVLVMMHPCFRVPRQSDWGWDEQKKTQYRRVDRYLSPLQVPIATHPGSDPGRQTLFHHRSLGDCISGLGRAGLAVVAAEELTTHREPPPGPRHRGHKRSFEEIPVFLALKAVRWTAPA
jgi:ubiquinone/menaquinone biosynthesis C-methylase UbiE